MKNLEKKVESELDTETKKANEQMQNLENKVESESKKQMETETKKVDELQKETVKSDKTDSPTPPNDKNNSTTKKILGQGLVPLTLFVQETGTRPKSHKLRFYRYPMARTRGPQ